MTIYLNPDSIQTAFTATGVKRGQGWRPIDGLQIDAFPAIVRFLICDEKQEQIRVLGSGSIIGIVDQDWLIICTASHVFEDIERYLDLEQDHRLSHLDTDEDRLHRRYNQAMLNYVYCGVCIPELGREIFCPIASAEVSKSPRHRDTALIFIKLPPEAAGKAYTIPIDIGPPPRMDIPLFIAGFNDKRINVRVPINSPGLATPERHLILREGFLDGFGRHGSFAYDVAHLRIPIDGGMSGGPVIIYRPNTPLPLPVMVAIANSEIKLSNDPVRSENIEYPGIATPADALFTHNVFLPDNTEIPFSEAVKREMISTFGPEAYHRANSIGAR